MTSNNLPDTTSNTTDVVDAAPMEPVGRAVLDQLRSYAAAWSDAATIADQLARTDFAGPFKGKPADLAAAILKGASIGIPPEDIGKAIYVVHGTPALYAKTALAVARQHGYLVETVEDTPEAVTVGMTAPDGQTMQVRYTIARAEQEGLVKGNPQYKIRPSKMLYWKCVGELTDRMIPHLTGGMPVKEDLQQSTPVRARAARADRPTAPLAKRLAAAKPAEAVDVDAMAEEAAAADSMEALTAVHDRARTALGAGTLAQDEFEDLRTVLNARAEDLRAASNETTGEVA